jgi:hypothetical protein
VRSTSATLRAAVNAQQTGEVFLVILEIDHADMVTPIRVVNDQISVMSGGDYYAAFPFQVQMPDESDDTMPFVTLRIDNVDQQIVTALRQLTSAPTVTLSVVLASDPDTVEAGPFTFSLAQATYDANAVAATLTYEDVLSEPIPGDKFTPNNFPGVFAGVS